MSHQVLPRQSHGRHGVDRRLLAFALLGLTAMMADMVYEGGRSVAGPYLRALEASALIAGVVSVGELVGLLLRAPAGLLAERLGGRGAWSLVFVGYGMNLAIPLLAWAGSPGVALLLLVAERAGKGIRAPVKDALIASLTEGTRIRALAYGIHEVMDQLGAVAGPAVVAYYVAQGYGEAFTVLVYPYMASMLFLAAAFLLYTRVPSVSRRGDGGRGGSPLLFIIVASLPMTVFMHWSLAGYILSDRGAAPDEVAWAYMLAMIVDVALAIPLSYLHARIGTPLLLLAPVAAALSSIEVLRGDLIGAGILWGIVACIYETIVKSDLASRAVTGRFRAFGLLGLATGIAGLAGNIALSLLYGSGMELYYIAAAGLASLAAIAILLAYESSRVSPRL